MPGRNDPCPCGSGKKYKRCCGLPARLPAAQAERDHGRLVEEVTGWAEREFPGELRAALIEYVGERREMTEGEQDWATAWFLHDRELPGGGTPLECYANAGPDPRLRELAASHANAKLRLWRVLESRPGERLAIEPYAGGRTLTVQSQNISRDVARWDILLGRLKPDTGEFWGPVRSYAASDEDDLGHLLAQLGHRLGLDQDGPDQIARRAPAELFSFESRPLVPVTTEGDLIIVVEARWRARRDAAAAALMRCEQCLDDGGGSFTWIARRDALLAMQPDPMPRGAALVETSVLDIPGAVSIGEFSLKRDTLRYEGLSERRLGCAIDFIGQLLPDAKLLDSSAKPPAQAFARPPTRKPARSVQPLPPELVAAARQQMTDRWLSEPVPALEGLSPREAAAKGAYLPQLRSLLRGMESSATKMGGLASYPIDLDAVIAELGVRL
ncbi:MAG: SEC-C metal-binding domain-containing protein [Solirubrobacteraceae bacterium]